MRGPVPAQQSTGDEVANQSTELTVQGQSLQSLYTQYSKDTFLVNRRYQRKLVWAVEEKERLVDSIAKNLPIPLILLAEHFERRACWVRDNRWTAAIESDLLISGK